MDEKLRQLRDLIGLGETQRSKLRGLDDALHGRFDPPFLPSEGTSMIEREYRELISRAELPILHMIVRAVVDRLLVDGMRSESGAQDEELWRWWQSSNLDSRQQQLFSDSISYGNGYLTVTPGLDAPVYSPESPLVMAVEHDPLNPVGTLSAAKVIDDKWAWLYTDEAIYAFEKINKPQQWQVINEIPHPLGVCPVVRFPNRMDTAGRSYSEVMESIPIQRRINQTIMTRLLLEASAAWKQRYVAGIDVDHDENGNPISPFNMAVDKLLIAPDSDTTFGEYSASTTQDLMQAVEQDLRHIAVVTQTPPTLFAVTSISNISTESLAALEGGLTRKVNAKKEAFDEGFEYAMQLGGQMIGYPIPDDLEMMWKNLEISSLSQRSNAYVQLRGAGLPMEFLLESIMDLTPQGIERVMAMAEEEAKRIPLPTPTASQAKLGNEAFSRGNGGSVN